MPWRSLLFVPGNQPRKLQRAFDFGADAVMYELEDAVPLPEKATARAMVADAIRGSQGDKDRTSAKVTVRVNSWRSGELFADLDACVWPELDLIKITKISSPLEIARIDGAVSLLESDRGIPAGTISLLPEIDSAANVLDLESIARASQRVRSLNVSGGQDFANDLGVEVSEDMAEARWASQYGVLISRKLGLEPPIHGSVGALADAPRRERILRWARATGFQGASCIHPSQVPITNEIFSPTENEIERATRTRDAYEESEARGIGTVVLDGDFIDEAHYRGAVNILARGGRAQ